VTGFFDLQFVAYKGDEVRIRYAETATDGQPAFESSYAGLVGDLVPEGFRIPGGPGAPERAEQLDRVLCTDGEQRFTNEFCVHSFRYAVIEGLDENDMLLEGESCTIRVREGLVLRAVEADAGTLTENEDGSWTLEDLDADATLTLEAQAEAPVFDLAEGCYAEAQTLSITGPEGAALYYSLDGSAPDEDSLLYEEPIQLTEGCTVCAAALLPGAELSEITRAEYAFVTITAPELPDGTQGEEPPEAAAFTVENTGKTPAVIESVSLSGKSASYFSLSTEEGGTVKAGKSDSKTWTLRPAADLTRGNYRATVIFTLDGGQTVQLDVRYKVK
jgi:hypothetical protein